MSGFKGVAPLAKRNRLPPAVAHLCSHRYIGYIPEHTSTRLIFSRVFFSRKYISLSELSRNIAVRNSDIPSKFKTYECYPTSLYRRSPYRSMNSRTLVLWRTTSTRNKVSISSHPNHSFRRSVFCGLLSFSSRALS